MRLVGLTKAAAQVAEVAPKLKELRKAGEGIEAMFVRQLLGEMQKSTKLFGEGQAGSVYGDLFNEALAKQIANRGAFGIADMMVNQATPRILAEAAKRSGSPPTSPLPSKTIALRGEGQPEDTLNPTSTELSTDKRQS